MNLSYPNHSMAMHGKSSGNCENDSFQILKDTDNRGKERDWKGKKKRSLLMAEHHAAVEELSLKFRTPKITGFTAAFSAELACKLGFFSYSILVN